MGGTRSETGTGSHLVKQTTVTEVLMSVGLLDLPMDERQLIAEPLQRWADLAHLPAEKD